MEMTKKMMKQLKVDAYATSGANLRYKEVSNFTHKGHCEPVYMKRRKIVNNG